MEKLNKEINFHNLWKEITCWLYVATTTITIGASTGATVMAAIEKSLIASILAGLATALMGIEKTLLFREKWKLHLHVTTQLKNLENKLSLDLIDMKEAFGFFEEILVNYSNDLPFDERDK